MKTHPITISSKLLEEAGYKDWNNPNKDSITANNWQKCLKDDKGKKYFINIKETIGWNGENNSESEHNWWSSIQLETDKGSVEFSLVQWFNESGQYSGNTIQNMEDYFEQIWNFHHCPYYELN